MRSRSCGFTLIELLVVIGILSLLIVALVPPAVEHRVAAERLVDKVNLQWHHSALTSYKDRRGHYPQGSGSRWLLAPWVAGVVERTEPNFRRYFTPGLEDSHMLELEQRGYDAIWKSVDEVSSRDTHYAARGARARGRLGSGTVPWIANDNEGGPAWPDGTTHVLMGDCFVKALLPEYFVDKYGYTLEQLAAEGFPVGPGSPEPLLSQLEK